MRRTTDTLLICVAALLALGAIMEFSVIAPKARTLEVGMSYLLKHSLWVTLGIIAMLILRRVDYHVFQKYAKPIGIFTLALLIIVLIPGIGTEKNGARRWIRIGIIGFQPSEVAKLGLLVVISAFAAVRGARMKEYAAGFIPAMAIIGVTVGFILLEPDFGTAALTGAIGLSVALAAGTPFMPIVGVGACGLGGLAYLILHSPARLGRVFAFMDPWAHLDAAGYQLIHSLLSLGAGGFAGRGLGAGQQKLYFLPEADTDFVLAVIGEEFGFIGVLAVIVLFVILIRQGMRIAAGAKDPFGGFLAFGITVMIALQALIHVAVVTASMPTKGITLPFVSSGGSSIVMTLAAVGVLMSIGYRAEEPAAEGKKIAAPVVG